jgi:hypothetical protein
MAVAYDNLLVAGGRFACDGGDIETVVVPANSTIAKGTVLGRATATGKYATGNAVSYTTTGASQVVITAVGEVVNFAAASANVVLTGSIDPAASVDVVGVGTAFTTELNVGDSILVSGETREVDTITDDTHLTVTVAFTDNANDTSPEQVGSGTGTVGHYYQALTVQTDVDLNQETFATDTTNWLDLGAVTGSETTVAVAAEDAVNATSSVADVKAVVWKKGTFNSLGVTFGNGKTVANTKNDLHDVSIEITQGVA